MIDTSGLQGSQRGVLQMPRVSIRFNEQEWEKLLRLSMNEKRAPADQAAYIVTQKLGREQRNVQQKVPANA
jgi:hypothetical protein